MKKGIFLAIIAIVIILLAVFLLFQPPQASGEATLQQGTIKIGALLPMTGTASVYGEGFLKGIQLAADEINAGGGINGKKIEIILEDSKADPKEALSAFERFEDASVIITGISGVVLSTAPLAEREKKVLINVGAKSPAISSAGDFVFSDIPNSTYDEEYFADFVKNKLKISRVSTLSVNNDYGIGTSQAFANYFSKIGGIIVSQETYASDAMDFRTQIVKLKSASPEGVFIVGYKEQGVMLKQALELDFKPQWLAGEPFATQEMLALAGQGAEGAIYHTPVFDTETNSEPTAGFVKAFEKKFFREKPEYYSGTAYDALKLAAEGIRTQGNEGEKVKNWLYTVKDWNGVTGRLTFNSNGDVITPLEIKTVKNGKFIVVND